MRITIELPDDTPLRLNRWGSFDDGVICKVLDWLMQDSDDSKVIFTSPLLEKYLKDENLTMTTQNVFEIIEKHMEEDEGVIDSAGQCEG